MAFGTLSTLDTLAASQQTIAAYGEDRAWAGISAALDAHNALVRDMAGELFEVSTDRQRRFGGLSATSMQEIDQYGAADAQKTTAGVTVGFPLRLYGYTVQWTRKYMQTATAAELAAQFQAAQQADLAGIQSQVKRALLVPTNATFVDRLVDNVQLAQKALVNADSADIPPDPYGATFDGATHTHYLGTGSFVNTDLDSLINTVIEHYNDGEVRVYINKAQEATIRGFTGFVAYVDARIISATSTSVGVRPLDTSNLYNRAIGVYGGAEIWVKPWVPASYVIAINTAHRPLVFRVRQAAGGFGDLQIAAEDEQYPLRARFMEREFGIGVWNRTAAAVLYTASGTYAAPTSF
jgi:hypothetical protein